MAIYGTNWPIVPKTVKVVFKDEDYLVVAEAAGEVPLSRWIRGAAMAKVPKAFGVVPLKQVVTHEQHPLEAQLSEQQAKPRVSKHPNRYCKEHHAMGCLVCE
jgi:hypothetical protein